jgi:hypothetical protein
MRGYEDLVPAQKSGRYDDLIPKDETQKLIEKIPGGSTTPPGTYSSQVPEPPSVFERGFQALAGAFPVAGAARLLQSARGAQRLYGTGTTSRVVNQLLSALPRWLVGLLLLARLEVLQNKRLKHKEQGQ